jgi:hypothetical protein
MSRLQPFWAVVRISLVDTERDAAEFNTWYDDVHVPEFVEQPGIDHAWRTEKVEHEHQLGEVDEQYAAIYQLDAVTSFQSALDASPTAGHSWFAWEGRVEKWRRTFFRVLTRFERDGDRGPYWATIRVSYVGDEESEFNRWYDEEHMPEVASNPGFHRAWRLKHEPSGSELGVEPRPYWAVYEIDDPQNMVDALRGKRPWGGRWQDDVAGWTRTYHRVLLEHTET